MLMTGLSVVPSGVLTTENSFHADLLVQVYADCTVFSNDICCEESGAE